MSLKRILAALAVFTALTHEPAAACDNDDRDGKDVALVLSGGGALTSAQVGALKVIEELGVPYHCIIGTSMGAVTGAFLAAGYSVSEIEDIYRADDWGQAFRGGIGRKDKPYLQKENEDQYFSDYFAGFGDGQVKLPSGLSDMSGLQAKYRHLLVHLPSTLNFDDGLEVPFRPVAMNLSTGAPHAFQKGDLVQTMLASMSVSGLFPPVEIEDELYVDGGMASQLPVRAALAMGADIIIALDTTIEPQVMRGPQSVTSTSQQLLRITIWNNWKVDRAKMNDETDVLIRPDLTGLSSGNFTNVEKGFQSGEVEARKYVEQLKKISALAAPSKRRDINPHAAPQMASTAVGATPPSPDLIIENETAVSDAVIRDRFGDEAVSKDDPDDIDRRLKDLAAFDAFGNVDFTRGADRNTLRVAERSIGRNLLQAGFRASTTFDGDSQYAIQGRISRRPISSLGGEASLSLEIGSDFGVTGQIYQPLGRGGRFFAIPAISYRSEEILFDIGELRLGEFNQRAGSARLRIGRELGSWGVLSVEGISTIGRIRPQVVISPELLEPFSYKQGGVGAFFGVDTLERSAWPTSGLQLRASGEKLFDFDSGVDTDKYSLFLSNAFGIGQFGVQIRALSEGVLEENNEPVEVLSLGGFRRLSAFAEGSIPNNQYVLATLEVFRRLTTQGQIVDIPIYIGGTFEFANVELDILSDIDGIPEEANTYAGSVYLGGDTIIGPVILGAGIGEGKEYSIFLHVGRAF